MTATALHKREMMAELYRGHAQAATEKARACTLDRAREQHEASAAVWTKLAEGEERRALATPPEKPAPRVQLPVAVLEEA